jgi:oxygen-dependent protoporphyrinogen oxidase
VTRRLGAEALDRIAEPLLSGIYNADAERQSLLATFPQFRQTERTYGSLTRGMLAARRKPKPAAHGKRVSVFTTFREGTDTLIRALTARASGDLRLNTAVEQIDRTERGYRVALSDGTHLDTDAVILAAPAYAAAALLQSLAPVAADALAAIRYVSTGTISLAYRVDDVRRPLPGFGLVIPRSERRPINAVTICSTKFDGRAPEGAVLLRAFFGGSRSPETMALDDESLLTLVRAELKAYLGIEAAPLFHRIYRWRDSNPQYDVGHLERLAQIESALPKGIVLAGGAYRGVGMPDCIHQAQAAAESTVTELQTKTMTGATAY